MRSILVPSTFYIASLKRYTAKFSGSPQQLTWCRPFGNQVLPKSGKSGSCPPKKAKMRWFFAQNRFSWQNGQLLREKFYPVYSSFFTLQMENFTQISYTSRNCDGCDKVCLAASIKTDTALFVYCVCMHKKIETGFSHVFHICIVQRPVLALEILSVQRPIGSKSC